MNKRRKQFWIANAKAILILTIVAAIAYSIGMLIGFFMVQPRIEYREVYIEKEPEEMTSEIIQNSTEKPEEPKMKLHGNCRITAYCSCEKCCGEWSKNRPTDENGNPIVYGSSGIELTPGVSVACSLPYGTKIQIDGLPGTYVVEDHTAEWIQDKYNGMTVDIYMDSHEACYDLLSGMPEWMDVYIVED